MLENVKCLQQESGEDWTMINGDSVEVIKSIPNNSIGLSVYSPPFSNLYTYSDSQRDMGNSVDDSEFFEHYKYLIGEMLRCTIPGRLCAVHCKDLVSYAGSSENGCAGIRDFSGELIRAHQSAGWQYHSRVTVWKCPKNEMQKTKAHGLLYKQLKRDSSFSRHGMAEYVLLFRKWAKEGEEIQPVTHTPEDFPLSQWQQWASPVWMDIDQTNVLNARQARGEGDEKHICPLQLDLIERCIRLWSNPGDVVFSPFGGIGSEPLTALKCDRKALAIELKPTYFNDAVGYLQNAKRQFSLF